MNSALAGLIGTLALRIGDVVMIRQPDFSDTITNQFLGADDNNLLFEIASNQLPGHIIDFTLHPTYGHLWAVAWRGLDWKKYQPFVGYLFEVDLVRWNGDTDELDVD